MTEKLNSKLKEVTLKVLIELSWLKAVISIKQRIVDKMRIISKVMNHH